MNPPPTSTRTPRTGVAVALVSALTFGSSGAMAKALIDTGWTSGAAALVRIGGAALVLAVAATVRQRGRVRLPSASWRTLVVYGAVAVAGAQLAFFNAVRTLDVGVVLLLEFTAPVLLVVWTTVRSRRLPSPATTLGAALTVVGLGFVLDLAGAGPVDVVGVAWGMTAAVCLATFFVLSERQRDGLPPAVMAAGGTAVGAVVLAVAGAVGAVPLASVTADVALAGVRTSWLVPAAWLVLVSTSVAYLTGIAAVRRLGTRSASFVALTEVLFAVLFAWALLAQIPGPMQVIGGACIIAGIVVVRRTEPGPGSPPPPRAADEGAYDATAVAPTAG